MPADETAVWQDEVEIHTNPKSGRMGMPKGQQAKVQTQGTNRKQHLAESIHWRSGQVFVTEAAIKTGMRQPLVPQALGRPSAAVQDDPRDL